jgi:hypothetical protein
MATGMWVGIERGLANVREQKRYDQERQDRLDLLNRERQDKLFSLAVQLAPRYTAGGVMTSSSGGGGTSSGGPAGTSTSFYEQQLKAFNFPEEAILDLQEKGPYAMQTAIEVYKDQYDPTNPPEPSRLQRIADGIIIENVSQQGVDPRAFAEKMGLNLDIYPEDERPMMEEILRGALTPAPRAPNVASTAMPIKPIKFEDISEFQNTIKGTLNAALEEGALNSPEGKREAFVAAIRALEKGSTMPAVQLLQERGELAGLMGPIFEYRPEFKDPKVPIGVYEPIRKALMSPTQPQQIQVPEQALQSLRANRDNPSLVEAFEAKYGVSAEEYL